jgi:hypothetical protein
MLLPGIPSDPQATPTAAPGETHHAAATRHRALLFAGCALAALAGLALGDPGPRMAADPELATLLRGMAGIRVLLLLGALALLAWRLGRPVAPAFVAIYLAGAAVMAFSTALIWQLSALPLAATAFHVAEIGLLLAAWRDLR